MYILFRRAGKGSKNERVPVNVKKLTHSCLLARCIIRHYTDLKFHLSFTHISTLITDGSY